MKRNILDLIFFYAFILIGSHAVYKKKWHWVFLYTFLALHYLIEITIALHFN